MQVKAQESMPEVIGLIPAGGQATRLAPLPASKELYPIGFRSEAGGNPRPKVVSHYLLENMRLAGIQKAFMILRPGKWDIPAYYGDGAIADMHLGYLTVHLPYGVPFTLDQAYPFVRHARIAVGFPDILFQPQDAFKHLLERQSRTQADVVIGVVPFDVPHKGGMVDLDAAGRVHKVVEKPSQSDLKHSWYVAVWAPTFTEFMHQFLADIKAAHAEANQAKESSPIKEVPLGDVIQAAIENGLRVEAEVFSEGHYLDVGTPHDLIRAVQHFANQALSQLSI